MLAVLVRHGEQAGLHQTQHTRSKTGRLIKYRAVDIDDAMGLHQMAEGLQLLRLALCGGSQDQLIGLDDQPARAHFTALQCRTEHLENPRGLHLRTARL